MTNPVAQSKKQYPKQPAKETPRKDPPKMRDSTKSPAPKDTDFPSGWAFAT